MLKQLFLAFFLPLVKADTFFDHFKISIASEANNQSRLFFQVYIQRGRGILIVSVEICNWVAEKSRQCVFWALRINSGGTEN